MPLNENEQQQFRDKIKPLIIKYNVGLLNETDFNTALAIVNKQQKLSILSAIVENDSNSLLNITQGLVTAAQSVKADSIIDNIIQEDAIDLQYLLSIL